jgi:hypothetical protein
MLEMTKDRGESQLVGRRKVLVGLIRRSEGMCEGLSR